MLEALEEETDRDAKGQSGREVERVVSQPLPSISRDDEVQGMAAAPGTGLLSPWPCGRAVVVITVVNVVSNRGKTRAGGGTT